MSITLEWLEPHNKFFKVTYTKDNISTYLIHRGETSLDIIQKYNSNLLNNYIDKLPKTTKINFNKELKLICDEVNVKYFEDAFVLRRSKKRSLSMNIKMLALQAEMNYWKLRYQLLEKYGKLVDVIERRKEI